jgi:hypothetical protein
MISNPLHCWRRLPRKRRVQIIAFLLFALAALLLIPVVAEFAIFVAPILDIATLIDAFGALFILSATAVSFYRPLLLLADFLVCPFRRITSWIGESFAGTGSRARVVAIRSFIEPSWQSSNFSGPASRLSTVACSYCLFGP